MRKVFIRKQLEKYIYVREKRQVLLKLIHESDEEFIKMIGDRYTPVLDEMPDLVAKMKEIEDKEI